MIVDVSQPLAITGIGCICSLGKDVANIERALSGKALPVPAPSRRLGSSQNPPPPVFELPDEWLATQPADMPRCSRLALLAAEQAIASSGLESQRKTIGVSLGTVAGNSLYDTTLSSDDPPALQEFRRFNTDFPTSLVRRRLKLKGPQLCSTVACSSGGIAIAQAAAWIRGGYCDAALAGGAEALTRLCVAGFSSLQLIDSQPCRPFDRNRAGLNLGEGAGVLLIESTKSAQARGATVLGWLLGDGNASDACHIAHPHPQATGLRRALADAMTRSGLHAADIAFINAHGTGTIENDVAETLAFRADLPSVPFLSTKGLTGHTLGAAGGIEAVLTLLCLRQRRIPASAGFTELCPDCGVAPTVSPQRIEQSAAISTSLGFGGSNCALIFSTDIT